MSLLKSAYEIKQLNDAIFETTQNKEIAHDAYIIEMCIKNIIYELLKEGEYDATAAQEFVL